MRYFLLSLWPSIWLFFFPHFMLVNWPRRKTKYFGWKYSSVEYISITFLFDDRVAFNSLTSNTLADLNAAWVWAWKVRWVKGKVSSEEKIKNSRVMVTPGSPVLTCITWQCFVVVVKAALFLPLTSPFKLTLSKAPTVLEDRVTLLNYCN